MDDYYFYRAIDLIKERGKDVCEGRKNALRTDADGLLTGIIYCFECGQYLKINYCKRYVQKADSRQEYHWDVYRCYRKLNSRSTCPGQSTYNAERVEEAVFDIVRAFFARIRRTPQEAQIKALKDAKTVAALEGEALKALTGESRLDLSIINQLIPKQKAALEQAQEEYQRILLENQAEEEYLTMKRLEMKKTLGWAQMFDVALSETKQMILSNIIERVTMSRKYKIHIEMKL